jgi:hypothetical protein
MEQHDHDTFCAMMAPLGFSEFCDVVIAALPLDTAESLLPVINEMYDAYEVSGVDADDFIDAYVYG